MEDAKAATGAAAAAAGGVDAHAKPVKAGAGGKKGAAHVSFVGGEHGPAASSKLAGAGKISLTRQVGGRVSAAVRLLRRCSGRPVGAFGAGCRRGGGGWRRGRHAGLSWGWAHHARCWLAVAVTLQGQLLVLPRAFRVCVA